MYIKLNICGSLWHDQDVPYLRLQVHVRNVVRVQIDQPPRDLNRDAAAPDSATRPDKSVLNISTLYCLLVAQTLQNIVSPTQFTRQVHIRNLSHIA